MTTKDYEKLFQERVDELLFLEQRADRRAEKFLEITNKYQKKNQEEFDDLLISNNIDLRSISLNSILESDLCVLIPIIFDIISLSPNKVSQSTFIKCFKNKSFLY